MNLLNNSLHLNFSAGKHVWLFLSLQVTLFGHTLRAALSLNDWQMYSIVKPWSAKAKLGPLSVHLVDENLLEEHIHKVLSENEDKFHSES